MNKNLILRDQREHLLGQGFYRKSTANLSPLITDLGPSIYAENCRFDPLLGLNLCFYSNASVTLEKPPELSCNREKLTEDTHLIAPCCVALQQHFQHLHGNQETVSTSSFIHLYLNLKQVKD